MVVSQQARAVVSTASAEEWPRMNHLDAGKDRDVGDRVEVGEVRVLLQRDRVERQVVGVGDLLDHKLVPKRCRLHRADHRVSNRVAGVGLGRGPFDDGDPVGLNGLEQFHPCCRHADRENSPTRACGRDSQISACVLGRQQLEPVPVAATARSVRACWGGSSSNPCARRCATNRGVAAGDQKCPTDGQSDTRAVITRNPT